MTALSARMSSVTTIQHRRAMSSQCPCKRVSPVLSCPGLIVFCVGTSGKFTHPSLFGHLRYKLHLMHSNRVDGHSVAHYLFSQWIQDGCLSILLDAFLYSNSFLPPTLKPCTASVLSLLLMRMIRGKRIDSSRHLHRHAIR